MKLGQAIAMFAASAYLLMVLAVLLLPETQGVDLEAVNEAALA
jgi:riboflavin transporter FmnP